MFIAFLAAAVADPPKATAIDPGSWFSPDDYPVEAQRKGTEGRSTFEVDVDAQGKPTACRITHSSGSPILDQTTCDIVLKRAQFKPATSHGHPVAGRYSQSAIWKLQGTVAANGYAFATIDFSKDAAHRSCSTVSKGLDGAAMCDELLKQFSSLSIAKIPAKVVALMSITTTADEPYRGEPGWGRRMSFESFDLYSPKSGSKPACAVVANEGSAAGLDLCAQYTDAAALSDEDKKSAAKIHIERSIFVLQSATPAAGKCKDGESAAETRSCE